MNEEKLKQILSDIGQTSIPPDVAHIAEQATQSFTAALNLLQSQRQSGFFVGFKRVAVAAVIFFAFAIGLSAGRWSKPDTSINVAAYSPKMSTYTTADKNTNGFWQQKVLAAMKTRPYTHTQFNQTGLLNAYKQYLKEKYND
jgi:hypothetical protein